MYIGYELAWYDMARVRVDWKPYRHYKSSSLDPWVDQKRRGLKLENLGKIIEVEQRLYKPYP